MKLPYGLADYYDLITGGYLYVDRTSHIRFIEDFGRALVFIRPRRFGKSLWLRTLACYYDLRLAEEFDRLFGHLAAGREPTPLHNRYFVLEWDFSLVDPRGDAGDIGGKLWKHCNGRIKAFLRRYRDFLPAAVEVDRDPAITLDSLLAVIEETPYKLYLLIDEYDNFINEVMTKDAAAYRALVYQDGPFKQLFKAVKAAMAGRGLERVFLTGISPVALSDVSSGFNVARDVYLEPELATLCGFREAEIRDILERIADERKLSYDTRAEALATMRNWYNGYRFCEGEELVYNPTNALHFLDHLERRGAPPAELHDRNLAMDQGKMAFVSRNEAGARVITGLAQGDGTVDILSLEKSFSMEDLLRKLRVDERFIASFLYYLGLLTHDQGVRFRIPNLVVRKLYLDRMLELSLPAAEEVNQVRKTALDFYRSGELAPLLELVEAKLLPVLSHRDARSLGRMRGQGASELALKSLLLSLLFDDQLYTPFSEIELAQRFADLCLLVRPHRRDDDFLDFLFELKHVPLKQAGQTGEQLHRLDAEALCELPAVAGALAEAHDQAAGYSRTLADRFGQGLRLHAYAVVMVGLQRLVGKEVVVLP